MKKIISLLIVLAMLMVMAPTVLANTGSVPNGGALALGDNNVTLVQAMMPAMASKWTYTATEAGNLTVTVSSIDGNSNLGMAFGRGAYTLLVGDVDGQYTNTATVYMNANDTVDIAVLNPNGPDVPAVITLSFAPGAPAVEKDPDDYFAKDPSGNYIIPSLAQDVEIFVGNEDINYIYTAESAGTVTVTPTVTDYTATNCWIQHNGGAFDTSASPVTVAAGDVVIINIWGDYEGIVSLTAGGGNQGGGESGGGESGGGESGGEQGGNNGPITGTASAEEDSKYVYSFTATENGTLTITVGNGTAWVSDVMDYSSFGIIASASDTNEGYYTCDVVAGGSYGIRIYGAGEPCAAISNIPYTITFVPSGTSGGLQLEDYKVSDTQLTTEGTHDVTVAVNEAEVTLYNFEPGATGQFKIELVSGDVAMALWSNNSYSKIEDAENGVLTVNITDPNQSYFIALAGTGAAAQLKVTKTGDAESGNIYPTTNYANKDKPVKFEATADDVTGKVDITDSKVDTAVLGKDGYYHLNSEDGEILYVDFKAEAMNLIEVWKNGSTSYAKFEAGRITEVIKYQDALAEYLKAEVKEGNYTYGNSYHPLTADLIEMLKNIGENNGWYGENGMVGKTADAWMFACVTMKAKAASPETGDFGVIAAVIALGTSAVCGTAVIAKKKEN